jgi:hypothetical protein
MKSLEEKLNLLKRELKDRNVRIMIIGLGSVGNYLLDYLLSTQDEKMEICVVGRNIEKMLPDVNIIKIASLIRGQNRSPVSIIESVDLNNVSEIIQAIDSYKPDIIVNSSRAYSGLKYGSISWKNVRAYGIWAPLSMKYTKNIMEAYEQAKSEAIVITTSYPDAVISWLESAGRAYPDFGSGNINHLIPRIKLAAAESMGIRDYWNIDVTMAVSHFHDVVISKEGRTEGVEMLVDIRYGGQKAAVDVDEVIAKCNIPMPVDAKRNMMNASSNFEIIQAILSTVRKGEKTKLHCPGVFGEIGGYPVIMDGTGKQIKAYICEEYFELGRMREKNKESIYLDGIEDVKNGVLIYTDELVDKVKSAFGVVLRKKVSLDELDDMCDFLIHEIIEQQI